jgi:hypothetical protein
MSTSSNRYLLKLKKNSMIMMARSGYDISEDEPVFGYTPKDMDDYHVYAKGEGSKNIIREMLLKEGFLNTLRSTLSTIYESNVEKGHFAIVYFAPRQKGEKTVSVSFIKSVTALIAQYPYAEQKYCAGCKDEICEDCPPPPQIIVRCVIITEVPLTTDAKQVASASVPRIKASTGVPLETGCLIQTFMDYELSYDILAHSMGSRYQVMTREETIDFFENADDGSSPNSVSESQIARIDMNGAICRYLGLYPGQLLRVERETVVPGTMLPYEITYRLVCSIPKIKKNRRRGLKDKNQAMAAGKVIS